ncbi:MAG: sigma 54-interacting transcriptional regulator [Clostridiales Family XIII bacterium]|jgi:propionate catabolism regulator PrpR|nr:sigma 54-interacting transcriptional regulator [Clostridiales Family XIII bacterium]
MNPETKIRLALIATYPEMSKIFLDIANKSNIIAYDEYASFDDALVVAKKMESKVDVILSRGGTAAYIRDNVSTPVVFIPITSFDVLQAVRKLDPATKEAALFHYDQNIYGINDIQEMFGLTIREYRFETHDDIEQNVKDVMRKGIRTIIGGKVAMRLAAANGLSGVELSAGLDTIDRAINEAVQIVQESRKIYYQAARIEAAFNAITEGIVITDENEEVLISNSNIEQLLGRTYRAGERFNDVVPDSKFRFALESLQPQYDYLRDIGGHVINVSHIPVERDGRLVGVVNTFEDISKIQNLEQNIRKQLHEKGLKAKYRFEDILTQSESMLSVKKLAASYATTDLSILLEGESGTGKELFAQSIHDASSRRKGPFVAVNCAAISENLLESELFGYEPGAFTGASKTGKQGLFELAHRGSIFLDEIGEMPIQLQTRLLRVLQEKEVMRVGGSRNIPVDIRVISASNHNLLEMTGSGDFREDLYYRLNVLNITLPPLRRRKDDIELLCGHFLKECKPAVDKALLELLMPIMEAYEWPGNIRELQNVALRLSFISQHHKESDLRELITILGMTPKMQPEDSRRYGVNGALNLKDAVAEFERKFVEQVIDECHGNQDAAAKRLGIGRTTLWRKSGNAGDR